MKPVGIVTNYSEGYASTELKRAFEQRNIQVKYLRFFRFAAGINVNFTLKGITTKEKELENILENYSALIIRPIGKSSLETGIFRLDILHMLERKGLPVINPAKSIEICTDKYYTSALLYEKGYDVPPTIVTESPNQALEAFYELGKDVVIKPLFGSRGVGIVRINDPDQAQVIFNSLKFNHSVIYLQKFIPHKHRDIRVFVVGDKVVASMYRVGTSWKTNIATGAVPQKAELTDEIYKTAINASKDLGCLVSGVDFIESGDKLYITELNSQPGWKGIQQITKVDIAGEIADFVINYVRR